MILNLNATTIWAFVGLLLTVPLLSWLWSLVTIIYFNKLLAVIKELNNSALTLHHQMSTIEHEKPTSLVPDIELDSKTKEMKETYQKLLALVSK